MITNDIETFYKNMEIHDKRKIAKLEKEIEELKEQLANDIDRYEDTISYQLGFDKGKEYLQQKIDKALKELEWVLPVYTTPIGQVIHLEDKLASIERAIKILGDKDV